MLAGQDHATEILARAREAVGGETRLHAVQSLSLKASARQTGRMLYRNREYALIDNIETRSTFELDILLPDRFLFTRTPEQRTSRRYTGLNGDGLIDGQMSQGEYRPTTFLGPGTVPRVLLARKREFLRYIVAWLLGVPLQHDLTFADAGKAETPDGPADVLDVKGPNEFAARMFFNTATGRLSMLSFEEPPSTRPPGSTPVPANIRVLEDNPLSKVFDFPYGTATVFFDKDSHQVATITFTARTQQRPLADAPGQPVKGTGDEEPLFRSIRPDARSPAAPVVYRHSGGPMPLTGNQTVAARYLPATQMRVGDYRPVDGILLPHLITIDSGPVEEWRISGFKVNPKIDVRHFAPK